MNNPASVDEYITGFPPDVRVYLDDIRQTIKEAAPGAQETISYAMPCYKQNGSLVFFAAYRNYIGFYPMPSAIQEFKEELLAYKLSRGTVQFPLGQPLPKDLITRMVKFRLNENLRVKAAGSR